MDDMWSYIGFGIMCFFIAIGIGGCGYLLSIGGIAP